MQKESARDARPVSAKVFGWALASKTDSTRPTPLRQSCRTHHGMLLDVRRPRVRRAIHKDSDMASNAQTC
jgi:hypothetical protein